MTPEQRQSMQRRYHALHREICKEQDLSLTSDYRHQVAEWILGYKKSSRDWTGKEYSLVIDQIKDWIRGGQEPGPIAQDERARQSHDEDQKQLIHAIEQLAPDRYVQAIADKRHGKRPWRHHSAFVLKRLRFTVQRAHDRKAKKGGSLFTG